MHTYRYTHVRFVFGHTVYRRAGNETQCIRLPAALLEFPNREVSVQYFVDGRAKLLSPRVRIWEVAIEGRGPARAFPPALSVVDGFSCQSACVRVEVHVLCGRFSSSLREVETTRGRCVQ